MNRTQRSARPPNLSRLSLRDLEYAVAVADSGSFVRAAERCHVAQSSLSVQVRHLEERLQTALFERTSRRAVVTEEGHHLIEQMRKILKDTRSLLATAQGLGKPFGGTLRLSAISTLGPYYFPKILRHLRSSFPEVSLVLGEGKTDSLTDQLLRCEVDAIVMSDSLVGDSAHVEPLFDEPFKLACPTARPMSTTNGNAWAQVPPAERLLLEEGHCLRGQALEACRDVARDSRQATSLETLRYMVAAGDGYTLMPQLAATPLTGVSYVPLPATFARPIMLAWRSSDPHEVDFQMLAALLRSLSAPMLQDRVGTSRDARSWPDLQRTHRAAGRKSAP